MDVVASAQTRGGDGAPRQCGRAESPGSQQTSPADRQATRTAIVVLEMQSIAGGPAEGSMPDDDEPAVAAFGAVVTCGGAQRAPRRPPD
jgi:hypothetical protein